MKQLQMSVVHTSVHIFYPIPINTKNLLSYLSYLFRLRLLSEDSYLLEGLQSADKTKTHPKAMLQNAPTFTRSRSHSRLFTFGNKNENLYLPVV